MDAPYNQNAFLRFDFARYFAHELPVARINVARFQRASKCAEHSTGGGGNHVVDRRSVRVRQLSGIDFVVLGDCTVDAEDHRLRLTGQIGDSNGTDLSLDTSLRNVRDF
jgi:hypothetical protein